MSRTLRRYEIADHSMAPELFPGDYVVAALQPGGLRRGDIVVFAHPKRTEFELVKRVVALPGETVVIADGKVHIDGAILAEPWSEGTTHPAAMWKIPEDAYFALGDLRTRSADDSRALGPLSLSALRWRVAFRYWPLRRARLL